MDSQDEVESETDESHEPEPGDVDPNDDALLNRIRRAYERFDPVPPGLAERTTPSTDPPPSANQ